MDVKKYIVCFLAVLLFPVVAMAQTADEEDDLFVLQRPECDVKLNGPAIEGGRRVARRIGSAGEYLATTGAPRIPIVLVEFPDRPFAATGNTKQEVRARYDLFFNGYDDGEVYRETGSRGSVFSYFYDMSHGTFLPMFDIIGPIVLDKEYSYYGANDGSKKDVNMGEFYGEAVSKAVNQFNVFWGSYDNNNDGKVDMVYFVHAGWGENTLTYRLADGTTQNLDPDAIWAKEGASSVTVFPSNGSPVQFACYGVSAEALFVSNAKALEDAKDTYAPTGYNLENLKMDGIGVCVHEISHALGLPDFYDKKGNAYGMDVWSIMDFGEYCNSGYNPSSYNAYERNFMGWEELPVLDEPQVVTLRCLADGGVGCKVVNPAAPDEYYVLENRRPQGWDDALCKYGHGLVVTHVDYNYSKWNSNNVNTLVAENDHYRMTPITANGEYKTRPKDGTAAWRASMAGMPFPGNGYNYNFTDDSNPAAQVYSGGHVYSGYMNQPIRNITENEDGSVTFCFRTNGQLETPEQVEVAEVNMNGLTLQWHEVENALQYVVEVEDELDNRRIETVNTNHVTFSGLRGGTTFRLRVKAQSDSPENYLDSKWSDVLQVSTDEDYIAGVSEGEKLVTVYAANGQPLLQCHADELYRLGMRPGIYVVKYRNGATRKIVLR
ncbi:MAG: M6 family metalloprotease domain-containing protein [Bacteroidaceae bacterium]|nr:M6 family metalloprotease domain-containing protein [Bacteroidaceae bacterium]